MGAQLRADAVECFQQQEYVWEQGLASPENQVRRVPVDTDLLRRLRIAWYIGVIQ